MFICTFGEIYCMFRKIAHIIVAALILVSTTGFTINMHYCHNQLIDLALFAPAKSCCDTSSGKPCDTGNEIKKMSHCEDESIQVETTDDFVGSSPAFNLENTPTIELLFTAYILTGIQGSDQEIKLETPWHKEPPPYREVVLSHIQTYLI